MKEVFFILLVMLVAAALTAYRYRGGIRAFLEFWRMMRAVKQRAAGQKREIAEEPSRAGPLVHCPKCGKWVPEDESIRLGRSAFYCSSKCLEASNKTR